MCFAVLKREGETICKKNSDIERKLVKSEMTNENMFLKHNNTAPQSLIVIKLSFRTSPFYRTSYKWDPVVDVSAGYPFINGENWVGYTLPIDIYTGKTLLKIDGC